MEKQNQKESCSIGLKLKLPVWTQALQYIQKQIHSLRFPARTWYINTSLAMITPSTQILAPKYHSSLKESEILDRMSKI